MESGLNILEEGIGKIIITLCTFEFLIRKFLYQISSSSTDEFDFSILSIGDKVEINSYTSTEQSMEQKETWKKQLEK